MAQFPSRYQIVSAVERERDHYRDLAQRLAMIEQKAREAIRLEDHAESERNFIRRYDLIQEHWECRDAVTTLRATVSDAEITALLAPPADGQEVIE